MTTVFIRALETEDKAALLKRATGATGSEKVKSRFDVEPSALTFLPRSPFAYWLSDSIRELFKGLNRLDDGAHTVKQGLATADDFRFLRTWWEVPAEHLGQAWVAFAKGGEYAPFYSDVHLCVNWSKRGAEIKNNLNDKGGVRSNVWMLGKTSTDYFQRPGLTWPLRTSGLSFRALPAGGIFSHKGPGAFCDDDQPDSLLSMMAILNSSSFGYLVSAQLARTHLAQSFEIGLIQETPFPDATADDASMLASLARRGWTVKRGLDTKSESSHAFTLPALLQVDRDSLAARADAWRDHVRKSHAELADIQDEIDGKCFALYGIEDADRTAIIEGFANDSSSETDEQASEADLLNTTDLAAELVSWAVGVAFGRFDVRLATGERELPAEPEPLDALPVCSPGMLAGDNGLPLDQPPPSYPLTFLASGILVDDPGHADDLTSAVRAVFDATFGESAENYWQETAVLLEPKNRDMRNWLASSFFDLHLKQYSKSRRKSPIIWQLGIPSGRYSVWLHAHRLTRDSGFQLQNDVIAPKLAHEERKLSEMVQVGGADPSAKERKEIAAQESLVEELREMLDAVKQVASIWDPSLDDGVVLAKTPLWRLVPQNKAWQKELKAKWKELCAGKYDWSHIAMMLWPERVVLKCASDRSLAIAHDLDGVFWSEDADGKWAPRSSPLRTVEEIVGERDSEAVRAALASMESGPSSPPAGRAR